MLNKRGNKAGDRVTVERERERERAEEGANEGNNTRRFEADETMQKSHARKLNPAVSD